MRIIPGKSPIAQVEIRAGHAGEWKATGLDEAAGHAGEWKATGLDEAAGHAGEWKATSLDEASAATSDDVRGVRGKRANIVFVELLLHGFPRVAMATESSMKQGNHLLVDYGPEYWKFHEILDEHVWVPLNKLQKQRQAERELLFDGHTGNKLMAINEARGVRGKRANVVFVELLLDGSLGVAMATESSMKQGFSTCHPDVCLR